ncbi:DUF2935 domain-containing protein [Fictibacillus sp. Mic-4]|uniref:DUF2935 domain-containing protein n=1 Tax=Fictibacillus TaxID=1329200 RepID=UPI00040E0390|nr:DUF2935 domain-containing protein [Fictibacillus gelatini]
MQYYYGTQMPLRVLDEAEFWKRQEEEHTVVIRELVHGLEAEYVNGLKEWEKVFVLTYQRVVSMMETVIRSGNNLTPALYQDVMNLVSYCMQQSGQFIDFCNRLMNESRPIQANSTAKVVLKHIIDESEYFIGIARTILYQQH